MNRAGKGKESVIVIGILLVIITFIALQLAWIQLNRFIFWVDIVLVPLSLIGLIICIILLFRVDEWEREEWYIPMLVCTIVLLFTLITVNGAYNRGYSDEAIRKKADLENQLDAYTLFLSIYTGEFRLKVEGMIADQLNDALCEAAPTRSCETILNDYRVYQELIGWKEPADKLAKIWRKQ